MKTAIISGAFGQDAKWLADLLASQGVGVVLVYRYSSVPIAERAKHYELGNVVGLECVNICDPTGVNEVVQKYQPYYIYNLAAQSHVGQSFKEPAFALEVNAVGVLNWLEAIRRFSPESRFLQASTSEMWGSNYSVDSYGQKYQDEQTPFAPNSPYAVAKLAAHNLCRIYRHSYGLFACTSICHNHESPIRGENFVTRKITKWIGANILDIRLGRPVEKLKLGNIDAVRDWSHAKDIVRGMDLIANHSEPGDFVLCSGRGTSVRAFLSFAFSSVGIDNWEEYVEIDPSLYRPCEVEFLQGRADKAKEVLGWVPEISFEQLVEDMVKHDLG